MNIKNDDLEYAARLAKGLREYRTDVSKKDEAKRTAEEALEIARRKLTAAEEFYLMELERLGLKAEQVELPLEGQAIFVGMSPREACVDLLKERGPMTLDQLEAELKAGGFIFRASPKRVINMALLGRDDVERLGGGVFRYKKRVLPIDELEKRLKKYKKS